MYVEVIKEAYSIYVLPRYQIGLGILFEAYASPYSLKSQKKNVYALEQ